METGIEGVMDGIKIDVKVTVGPPQESRPGMEPEQAADRNPQEGMRPRRRPTVRYGVPKSTDGRL